MFESIKYESVKYDNKQGYVTAKRRMRVHVGKILLCG
jgi:hypothetical protein